MRDCTTSGAVVAVLSLLCAAASPATETGWFVVDGSFEDWESVPTAHIDPSGDGGGSGIDFGELRVASDAHRLHLDFEIGVDRLLQQVDEIVLFIDADNSASTGHPVGGIGAELEWRFGDKRGTAYGAGDPEYLYHEEIGLRVGPSYGSTRFEICVSRDVEFWGNPLIPGDSATILLRDESGPDGDRLPDEGSTLTVPLDSTPAPEYGPASICRHDADDLRVLTYNVAWNGLFDSARRVSFARTFFLLEADVICLQELPEHTAEEVRDVFAYMLPYSRWFAAGDESCKIVSRYPIVATRSMGFYGRDLWALIDLPDDRYATDLSIVCAHLKAKSGDHNDDRREEALDEITAWHREIQNPGGAHDLPDGTPILVVGDMNMYGRSIQHRQLLEGVFADSLLGDAYPVDWDGSALADVTPYQIRGHDAFTWWSHSSSYCPSRIDYIVYSDSVLELANHFIARSPLRWDTGYDPRHEYWKYWPLKIYMWIPRLEHFWYYLLHSKQYESGHPDDTDASDHLPVVADFRLIESP